jgi:Rrf2 family protein
VDRIIGISDRTNAALHALALAACEGGSISANAAAKRLGVSPSYLAKILQSLAAKGIITSTRGIGGGFSLGESAERISGMRVLEALDGSLPARYCLFERAVCVTKTCVFKSLCDEIESKLRTTLETVTVADLAEKFGYEVEGTSGLES